MSFASFGKILEDGHTTKFVLKNINPAQLDRQYILKDIQEYNMEQLSHQVHTQDFVGTTSIDTGISKLRSKPFQTIVINEDSHIRLFLSPAVQSDTRSEEEKSNINAYKKCLCWNCRHTIPHDWHPLGIPIKMLPQAPIPSFECEGVFCSFNCIVSYLNEHHDYRYKDSSMLLLMMYRKIFAKSTISKAFHKITSILPAPSWKLLKEYGGHMTIEEYRKSLQQVDYKSLQQLLRTQDIKLNTCSEIFVEI